MKHTETLLGKGKLHYCSTTFAPTLPIFPGFVVECISSSSPLSSRRYQILLDIPSKKSFLQITLWFWEGAGNQKAGCEFEPFIVRGFSIVVDRT